jgi:hypothetical protein
MFRYALRALSAAAGVAVFFVATSDAPRGATASIALQQVAGGFNSLVGIEHAGDGTGRLFLIEQPGRIRIYTGGQLLTTPFLDISSLVLHSGEQGLLGLAFHPQFASNGLFYVHYSSRPDGNTAVARYAVTPGGNVANPATAQMLLEVDQPFSNHKGGQIRFGPDGYLYIALGDGGSGGDPLDNGQNLGTLLGKLLRIDVNAGSPYGIPPSNPFVSTAGARGEIWAYGLRNPWRFSFDRVTGDLFIADVGQNAYEEVNFQAGGAAGGQNYGWRKMEGRHCYSMSPPCTFGTLPILEYSHAFGCSVTGGPRYRGSQVPALAGLHVFGDYCTGRIWGASGSGGEWTATQLLDSPFNISTFGEDEAGEVYLANLGGSVQLYRVIAAATPLPSLMITKAGNGSGRVTSSPELIECGSLCGAHVAAGTTVTLTAEPDTGWVFAGWTGDADCADGVVTVSADRTCVATFGSGFTDDPIAAGTTLIKAVHVTELRTRINAARSAAGLGAFTWTDPTLTAGTSVPRAVHITEMRTAINQAYSASGRTPPTYTDPGLTAGGTVKGVYITELRAAVRGLE